MITISHSDVAELLTLLGINCPPGQSMEVNETLNIRGVISKGVDTEANATVKTLSLATVGCILRHCGITRETAIDKALSAILSPEKDNPADLQFAEAFKQAVAAKLPKMPVSGRRTGKLIVSDLVRQPICQNTISIPTLIPAI